MFSVCDGFMKSLYMCTHAGARTHTHTHAHSRTHTVLFCRKKVAVMN